MLLAQRLKEIDFALCEWGNRAPVLGAKVFIAKITQIVAAEIKSQPDFFIAFNEASVEREAPISMRAVLRPLSGFR